MGDSLPTKEECQNAHARIMTQLMKDFESNLTKHKEMKHSYFVQNTVHSLCRELVLDKQLVVYLLLGSNSRKLDWGNLKEKYEINPIKYAIRSEIVKVGTKLFPTLYFKVYFTDVYSNGDFRVRIEFTEKTEKKEGSGKETNTWVKVVNKRFPKKESKADIDQLKAQIEDISALIAKLG